METDGRDVAIASALRRRVTEVPVSAYSRQTPLPTPSELPAVTTESAYGIYFTHEKSMSALPSRASTRPDPGPLGSNWLCLCWKARIRRRYSGSKWLPPLETVWAVSTHKISCS